MEMSHDGGLAGAAEEFDTASFEAHIGFQVHLTWRALKKRMAVGGRRADNNTQRGAFSIPLLIRANPGISPQQLAQLLFLDSSRVSFLLRDLEARAFVERVPSQTDGRMVGLHLTPAGEEFAAAALRRSRQIESRIGSALSDEQRRTLVGLLVKLREEDLG